MSTYFARERIIDALASLDLALSQLTDPADRQHIQTAVAALEVVSLRLDALPPAESLGALSALLLTVQAEWGVDAADIKSERREQPIAEARKVWCWLARHATPSMTMCPPARVMSKHWFKGRMAVGSGPISTLGGNQSLPTALMTKSAPSGTAFVPSRPPA